MKQFVKTVFVLFWIMVVLTITFHYIKTREKYLPVTELESLLEPNKVITEKYL